MRHERQFGKRANAFPGRLRRVVVAAHPAERLQGVDAVVQAREHVRVLLAVEGRHRAGIENPRGVGQAVAHRDAPPGAFGHAGRVRNLHAAVAELGEKPRHRVVRRQQTTLVENAGRDPRQRLGVREHAEQTLGRRWLARRKAQHPARIEMDDLAAPRDERHQVGHALIVDVRLHRRPDPGQAFRIEAKRGDVSMRKCRTGHQ